MKLFLENRVIFGPAKAANAGGVATSGLEMSQTACGWPGALRKLIKVESNNGADLSQCQKRSFKYGYEGNLLAGANIAGFIRVADAMLAQGVL